MALKDFSYLTLDETKSWLKIALANTDFDDAVTRMINTACQKVESFIDGPVLTREFVEFRDGNASNVIVPAYQPVRSITEIKIDYNHEFSNATIVNPDNALLRGLPARSLSETVIEIIGQDIVLRDDNNTALLGRLFAGSVIQSIKLTYMAGLAEEATDLPDDLVQATLMLVEYYYMLRENRDLGISSRGSMAGQNYHRMDVGDSGMPKEIETMLNEYKDYSLGVTDVGQHNTFTI